MGQRKSDHSILVVMDLLRRVVATLTGLLLLQLMLLGSGTACALRHDVARPEAAAHALTRMAHQTSAHKTVVVTSSDSRAPMAPMGCDGTADRDDCRLPFAPRQCSAMTTCDVSAALAATIDPPAHVRTTERELPSVAETHSGPSFAPELPPPRV